MRAKRRSRGSLLSEYRRIQSELRAVFDPFTASACPTCATPCCVKPTRVTPVDVALALGTGHEFPHLNGADPFDTSIAHASRRLELPMAESAGPIEYCEFLHEGRCTFPSDLRPYGCTTFLCGPMYERLPEETIKRLRRLIRRLDESHAALMRNLDG